MVETIARSHQLRKPPTAARRAGPTAPPWPSYTGTSQFVGISPTGRVMVYVDPSLGPQGQQNANDLLGDADRVVAANDALFGTTGGPVSAIVFALDGATDGTGGGDHMGCDYTSGAAIEVCASFDNSARVSALFEAELSECSMGGNLCGVSTGEALSRWCAATTSNNALSDFATAPAWAQSGMPDFVNQTEPTDRNAVSTGCGMAFLSWLISQGHPLNMIAPVMVSLGDGGTLAQLYASATGDAAANAWPTFTAAVNGLSGGVNSDDPFGGVFPTAQLAQLEPATIELAAKIFSAILSDVAAGRPAQHSVANVRTMMLMGTTARTGAAAQCTVGSHRLRIPSIEMAAMPAAADVAPSIPLMLDAPAAAALASATGGVIDCDVVIQAGHEDTPDDKTGGEGPLGNEIDWTPIVANEAVRLLRAAGVNAIKETAHIKVTHQKYRCKLALFIHFDAPDHGESGPSVGYDHPSDASAAKEWKDLYKEFFPFNDTWQPDNFTEDEHKYYGFKFTATSDAEFLIELGDLQSLRQAQWLKPRLKWLGNLIAHYVSKRIGQGDIAKPAAFAVPGPQPLAMALAAPVGATALAAPVGAPVPFTTRPSISGNADGSSRTKGLNGTKQSFDDGTTVIEATEALGATRADGLDATLTAFQRRVEKDSVATVEQKSYSYRQRQLPEGMLFWQINDFPGTVPAGFAATAARSVVASQFGKFDTEDEGTGSRAMGLIQTNSDVFGASIKKSVMVRVFGPSWSTNEKRLGALIEVFFPSKHRLVRVPLVDIGPGETIRAEVDLTWACDQFLGTEGQADVRYRVLVPA